MEIMKLVQVNSNLLKCVTKNVPMKYILFSSKILFNFHKKMCFLL